MFNMRSFYDLLLFTGCAILFYFGVVIEGLLCVCCVHLRGSYSRSDLSVDLTLAKSFIETLVGRHGNGQNRAIGMTQLGVVGQLVEYRVLIG